MFRPGVHKGRYSKCRLPVVAHDFETHVHLVVHFLKKQKASVLSMFTLSGFSTSSDKKVAAADSQTFIQRFISGGAMACYR